MGKVYILDTETSGLTNHPIHGHPQVIELAYIPVPKKAQDIKELVKDFTFGETLSDSISKIASIGKSSRYKPSMNIHPKAREVHGIWFKDLLKCPRSEDLELPKDMEYMVGHMISYDHRCIGKPELKLVCTKSLAQYLDKQLGIGFKNHKQDNLLLELYGEDIRPLVTGHHAALSDCVKCLLLLVKLLELAPGVNSIEELYVLQQSYKGKK